MRQFEVRLARLSLQLNTHNAPRPTLPRCTQMPNDILHDDDDDEDLYLYYLQLFRGRNLIESDRQCTPTLYRCTTSIGDIETGTSY